MKKLLYVFIGVLLFTSCDKWLEVKPVNEVDQEGLFESGSGYRVALNGLYYDLANTSIYGKEMSFAFVDVLSKQYDLTKLRMHDEDYRAIDQFEFEHVKVKPIIEGIWNTSYNIIANANNLINNIEQESSDLFELKEQEKNLILGEAIACRALLHFDLLRLFAPSFKNNDGGNYIPYVDTYPNTRPIETTVEKCLEKIVADLIRARELTSEFDKSELGLDLSKDKTARFMDYSINDDNLEDPGSFFKTRGYRLSYHAINALLARVYLYLEDYDNALIYANEVIETNFYQFNVSGTAGDDWENKKNLRLLDNLIFACFDSRLHKSSSVKSHFIKPEYKKGSYNKNYFDLNLEKQKVFFNSKGVDESGEDIRFTNLINKHVYFGNKYISGKWYPSEDESILDKTFNTIPMLRLTEMYYIKAECHANTSDLGTAKDLLSEVRQSRGCSNEITVGSLDQFYDELIRDAKREWISEGQLFFLLKRLNAKVDFSDGSEPHPYTKAQSVIPIPQNQSL